MRTIALMSPRGSAGERFGDQALMTPGRRGRALVARCARPAGPCVVGERVRVKLLTGNGAQACRRKASAREVAETASYRDSRAINHSCGDRALPLGVMLGLVPRRARACRVKLSACRLRRLLCRRSAPGVLRASVARSPDTTRLEPGRSIRSRARRGCLSVELLRWQGRVPRP